MTFEKRVWDTISIMKKKHGYNPTAFINMINDHGAIEAVRRLINSSQPSSGFTKLWENKALDLSMEAIILEEEWKGLFSEEERTKAQKRLIDYGYNVSNAANCDTMHDCCKDENKSFLTARASLMRELDNLPPEYLSEVTDFIVWLKHRKLGQIPETMT